ncbi:putative pumilio homolog 8, chloroplastic [Andrographis paniculata]|uniref:putative pumilio homolog 8, chloroplastic n=1 Tax=Andrographis paniculata TaxID=175694 RepID=UPI0021E8F0DF|nr:putative pumilio homolog 8, chloroplastic [Andrographis paniculata]
MAEDFSLWNSGSHPWRSETGFDSAVNHMSGGGASDWSHQFLPEASPYRRVNPNFNDFRYDLQLESDFRRLSLGGGGGDGAFTPELQPQPPPQQQLSYTDFASGVCFESNFRNNLPVSTLPFSHPQFDGVHQIAAANGQIGPQMQRQSFQGLANSPISTPEARSMARSLNGFPEFGNPYFGRSLNAAANVYPPRQIRSSFRSRPSRSNPNFRSESVNSASLLPPRPRYSRNFSSLEEVRGRIVMVAKDQGGARFLQDKFEEGNQDDRRVIFSEVHDRVCELMMDQFGNYLVQKMVELSSEEQVSQLLVNVVMDDRKFKEICIDSYGTRAMQKLLENLTTPEQKSIAISVLRHVTVDLTNSMSGHHVIQHCMKIFSAEDNKQILNKVADHCLEIATDKSGCCVLQQCVHHAQGEPRERLIAEISSNALRLSEHPYGNYVVQYVVGLRNPRVTAGILEQLSGHFVALSTNKYGSNVVEKCLKESENDVVLRIIKEIISSPNFVRVLQDPYGNYVAQSALAISKGGVRNAIIDLIFLNYAFLHSHPHGKRVLARTKGNKLRV